MLRTEQYLVVVAKIWWGISTMDNHTNIFHFRLRKRNLLVHFGTSILVFRSAHINVPKNYGKKLTAPTCLTTYIFMMNYP